MTQLSFTPWFDIDKDGPPVRNGVYEGYAFGTPDSMLQMGVGFYVWQDDHWCGFGSTPDEALSKMKILLPGDRASGKAQTWRGVVPDSSYPFDSVELSNPSAYTGVLVRSSLNDILRVERFKQVRHMAELQFSRERGNAPPIRYKAALTANGGAFVGKATGEVKGYREDRPTDIRLKLQKAGTGEISVVISIPDRVLMLEFVGQLRR